MNKQVLIADDHPLFREALRYIVSSVLPQCEITEATNYAEARDRLNECEFDLAFLDLNMPDSSGLTDFALIKKTHPQTPVVIVSAHEEAKIIRDCINLKAAGFIVKSTDPEDIKKAIQSILQGDVYVPPTISLEEDTANEANAMAIDQINTLTPAQLKVLLEIGKGKLNKQIAYDLEISEATVKAHITSVFKKLGLNNRTQAVLFISEYQAQNPSLT